jgi:hypothetical protein
MKVNRKYIPKPPPRHELRMLVSQLMAISRQMKDLLPHSQGWEISVREMMIDVSTDDSAPFMSGMMFSDDRTQDDMFAHSLADDILSHIRQQ